MVTICQIDKMKENEQCQKEWAQGPGLPRNLCLAAHHAEGISMLASPYLKLGLLSAWCVTFTPCLWPPHLGTVRQMGQGVLTFYR